MAQAINTQHETYLDQLLSETEAADFLGYSVRTLQGWRVKGGGPRFVKVSARSIRYRRRDLLAFIDRHTVAHTSEFDNDN